MAFRRSSILRRRGGYGGGRKIFGRNGAFTRRTRAKIIRVAQSTTPTQLKTTRRPPPSFKRDKAYTRSVRLIIGPQQTSVTTQDILALEASYYGITTSQLPNGRWNTIKVLSAKAWGHSPASHTEGTAQADKITLTVNHQGGITVFEDYGDGMARPTVSVKMPASITAHAAPAAQSIFTVIAGEVEFIDIYCEFS